MMGEMVERVARAICKSRTCEGVKCCQWPSQGGRTSCPVKNGYYDEAARAAIAAMREPTYAMKAFREWLRDGWRGLPVVSAVCRWRARRRLDAEFDDGMPF